MIGDGSRKELANLFLKERKIDFVGTDAHRIDYKSPEADVGAKAILNRYGEMYGKRVLYLNAELLMNCRKGGISKAEELKEYLDYEIDYSRWLLYEHAILYEAFPRELDYNCEYSEEVIKEVTR